MSTAGEEKQVLRCPSCEVRVALECDLLKLRKVSSDLHVGVFSNVVNLKRDSDFARCARCDNELFPLNPVQGSHELVLLYDSEEVFRRTPLRILTITKTAKNYFYKSQFVLDDNGEYCIENTYKGNPGKKALQDIVSIGEKERSYGMAVEQRNVVWLQLTHRDVDQPAALIEGLSRNGSKLVEKIDLWFHTYDFDTFREEVLRESTYDFILVSQFRRGKALSWSGVCARDLEEVLVFCWVASGGNMMLAQWGKPFHTTIQGEGVDVNGIIEGLEAKKLDPAAIKNRQDLLVKFMKEGLYLAWWNEHDNMPFYARERVENAIHSQHHSLWKFRSELNEVTFQPQEIKFFRGSRANEIKDMYPLEEEQSEASSEETTSEASLLTYVGKIAGKLYDSGVKLMSTLKLVEDG